MLRAVGELTRDFGRALKDRVFWLILIAMLLGLFEQSTWFIAPLALLLTLFSTVSDGHWFEMARERGKLLGLWLIWFGCLAQNVMFVGVAFVAGHATRWVWL
jgi:hypothetical protein